MSRNGRLLRVAVGNDTVQHDLMEIGRLQLEHLVDTSPTDPVRSLLQLRTGIVGPAEAGTDEVLTVLVEQIKSLPVGARRDLDQLGEAVADLSLWQRAEECEVEEGMDGSVVSPQTVLVPPVVDSNLDGNGCVDEADNRGGDADVVGVAAIRGTREAGLS